MRKTILFLLLIFIYSCQDADINDTSKRNENWLYWIDETSGKSSWVPVTGNETTLKNGSYSKFYTTGEIYQKGKLKNGKEVDTIYFYDFNEKPIQYLIIKSDTVNNYYLKNGPYISYRQNRKIFEKGIVKNHANGDEWTKYFDNGKIDWTKNLVNGTGWNQWYYKNGKIAGINYIVNGKTNGVVRKWHENGQLKELSYWKEGLQDGTYRTYFDIENIKTEGFYKNGKRHGMFIEYDKYGKVLKKIKYTNGQIEK